MKSSNFSKKKNNINQDIENYLNLIKTSDFFGYSSSIYTELSAHKISYLPVIVRRSKQDESPKEFEVSELIKNEIKVILYGEAGSGKTTTLLWLTHQYAQKYLDDENKYLPLFVELNTYNQGSFEDYILIKIKEYGIGDTVFANLLEEGCLIFLFDGLDLVNPKNDFDPYSEIKIFISDHSRNRVGKPHKYVISSRPWFFELFRTSFGFTLAELIELSNSDIHSFLEKYIERSDVLYTLEKQISDSDELRSLCRNPLMLSLVVTVALQRNRENNIELLPANKAKLYKEVVSGIFRHRSTKPHMLSDDYPSIIEKVLADFYFALQSENKVTTSYNHALKLQKIMPEILYIKREKLPTFLTR